MTKMKLTRFLTSPTEIAKTLDWKKLNSSVLALKISRQHVALTIASHPLPSVPERILKPTRNENYNIDTSAIDPIIPLKFTTASGKKILDSSVILRLRDIIQTHNICGFIVSWPLEKEGRIGADCGRVLYTLDAILNATPSEEEPTTIFSNNRKFCLWDESHVKLEQDDSFGRCSAFGMSSYRRENHVSRGRRKQPEENQQIISEAADSVWVDFCQRHWPNSKIMSDDTDDFLFDDKWLDEVFDEKNEAIRM